MRYRVEPVRFMPKQLSPGVIYVAEEFGAAAHLCACGCGEKVRTPLGPTEWSLDVDAEGRPSLSPSVGNWQKPCQSHYWITRGKVVWGRKWTPEEISAGGRDEAERRRVYYETLYSKPRRLRRAWHAILRLFRFER